MIKIVFVCLGNICRSPMAECVMNDMLKKRGLSGRVCVESRATSYEEEGNPIYPPAARKLQEKGIAVLNRRATRLQANDRDKYDYIVAMEDRNVKDIKRIIGDSDNVFKLLDFVGSSDDIADPWWTGDFERTFNDIVKGCNGLLEYIVK